MARVPCGKARDAATHFRAAMAGKPPKRVDIRIGPQYLRGIINPMGLPMEGAFKLKLEVVGHRELALRDKAYWRGQPPEARLAEVERLRREADSFLYERPTALRRVFEIARSQQG